jgi:hypothetical protein
MQQDFASPDGRVKVEFQCNEVKMSHWICNPRVTRDGRVLLDFWASGAFAWDGDASFDDAGRVLMHLRRYPGDAPGFDVRIDTEAATYEVVSGSCPDEARRWLEVALARISG